MNKKELYFLRHAIAVESGTFGSSEKTRPLTEEGSQRMIQSVKGFKRLKINPEVILSSPFTRAWQTAELVKTHLPFLAEIETEENLQPGGELEEFLKKIRKRKEERFLLVGHEPSLSFWIQDLLEFRGRARVQMKKGALCHLKLEWTDSYLKAELVSLLQPRVLRRIGSSD